MTNIVLFWSKPSGTSETVQEWADTEIELSPFHELTLASHVKFGHSAYLYTYQPIKSDIPDGIIVKDAHEIFSREAAFAALKLGHSIAHISDVVRLTVAADINGVVTDMDNIVVNPLPDVDGFTSTMPAKSTGAFAIKWGNNHPPFTIHDDSWDGKALSVFPIKVNKEIIPYIEELISRIKVVLTNRPKSDTKAWNFIMWELKEIARKEPSLKVMPIVAFGALPAWMPSGKCYSLESPTRLTGDTDLFGYTLPSIDTIMNETYMVQHFFESAFKAADDSGADFWEKVPEGCLLDEEAKLIFGDDWRLSRTESTSLAGFFG